MTLIRQSSTHHCFVCGVDNPKGLKINFSSDGNGSVTASKIFSSEFQSYPGIVHGGIISACLDEAAGRSVVLAKRPDIVLVTAKLTVRFRKPVHINETIAIEGKLINQVGRVYQTKGWLKNSVGEVLAEADVTLVEPGTELVDSIEPGEDQWVDWDDNGDEL
jgi:acyl-coenzyme A thioesterase PaaI-like protein